MDTQFITDHLTMQNLLNCYVKETGRGEWESEIQSEFPIEQENYESILVIPFDSQSVNLYVPVYCKSETGRHIFSSHMYQQVKEEDLKRLDFLTLIHYLQKDLSERAAKPVQTEELVLRTILSYQTTKGILENRSQNYEECYQTEKTFLQSEQSLLIGHQLHPTPKSIQGIDEDETYIFSPERKGAFQLHYFLAKEELVEEDSAAPQTATSMIKEELKRDPLVSEAFKSKYCRKDRDSLVPVHPLQARKLLGREDVQYQIASGKLSYLGPQGSDFYPTSSVRTLYHRDASYMYKFSIPVKITNSLRVNKRKELDRGVEVSRLLHNVLKNEMKVLHPSFKIIEDPAYITLKLDGEESGFEVVIRENPFQREEDQRTTLLAALCQDHIDGGKSHLANVIDQISDREGISTVQASENWFQRYLEISLRPLYWMYTAYGIALEPHQQNALVKLDESGYPGMFYSRDNQGYYFMESYAENLRQAVPDLNEKSDTICADSIAEERFRYYFFFNNLFGLINAFGVNRLIDEQRLLSMLKNELQELFKQYGDGTHLIHSLLNEEMLPCKANLLTRVHGMDELEGSLEAQSVYTSVKNPLFETAGELHGI